MQKPPARARIWGAGIVVTVAAMAAAATAVLVATPSTSSQSNTPSAAPPPAMPASVAVVERREVALWDEFSGRLEAIERVEVRSRVAGAVQSVHFREGVLVATGDLLITIDPAPYAAEVERAEAQVVAAQARLSLAKSELDRGRQLWDSRTVSQRDLDQRVNAQREAEANLRAAQAALQSARLNLNYTEIRAPVAGRVGKLEITVGNLVAAGPGAPVLTTLVSIDPIYASFSANEEVVVQALKALGANPHTQVDRIPVRMVTATNNGTTFEGRLQLIDNQVDAQSGTVRVRAVFANTDGSLMPGQFARLHMGRANTAPVLMVNDRAIGTDQNKKFVLVVGADNKAAYREVTLGASAEGGRIVMRGLKDGERVIVNGLQRIRPGALVAPRLVPMLADGAVARADGG
ncbi:MAG: efflux RND transporter periplasmic adaptor subunit [Rhizobiales bacterium]|nr:efflux RND transporter periplasmic adaptor subunit [Hyphomicrobiales bacterium]